LYPVSSLLPQHYVSLMSLPRKTKEPHILPSPEAAHHSWKYMGFLWDSLSFSHPFKTLQRSLGAQTLQGIVNQPLDGTVWRKTDRAHDEAQIYVFMSEAPHKWCPNEKKPLLQVASWF
jgi:hypothetical protein